MKRYLGAWLASGLLLIAVGCPSNNTSELGQQKNNTPSPSEVAPQATLNGPKGIAVANQKVYVVDTENQAIRVIDLPTGSIETLAGIGPRGRGFRGESSRADQALLNRPHGVCVDDRGNVYIGDSENHRVRVVAIPE